jgi:sterol desaturase/sphingolipid hydroxylase (fatty acid hydroxylase superfamily)
MNWGMYFFFIRAIGSRYFVLALLATLIFYILFRKKWQFRKIQKSFPQTKDYLREAGFSAVTIFIFGVVVYIMHIYPPVASRTLQYKNITEYGWVWYFAAYPVMLVVHDAYFYWTHRLMHHPRIFKYFHLVHHRSTNPSPWAAYAFHPLEAIVEAGILPVFLFTMPLHITHVGFFFLFMIVYNVYGHLGYELYPRGFNRSFIGKWINTSINHNLHHQYFKGNYGLYFLWWDRWMGTIRGDYDQRFEEVKTRVKE